MWESPFIILVIRNSSSYSDLNNLGPLYFKTYIYFKTTHHWWRSYILIKNGDPTFLIKNILSLKCTDQVFISSSRDNMYGYLFRPPKFCTQQMEFLCSSLKKCKLCTQNLQCWSRPPEFYTEMEILHSENGNAACPMENSMMCSTISGLFTVLCPIFSSAWFSTTRNCGILGRTAYYHDCATTISHGYKMSELTMHSDN